MGFKSPNYTQSPNDLFDEYMPLMGYAELKVVLFLCRHTFGFHRKTKRVSIRDLARGTGLTPRNAYEGAEQAIARGLITKQNDGGVTIWSVVVRDTGVSVGDTPKALSVSVRDTPSKKEKRIKKKDVPVGTQSENKRYPMMLALAEVTGMDIKTADGMLGRNAKKLESAGYSAEQVTKGYSGDKSWWSQMDWRGKKGQRPSISNIQETIKQATAVRPMLDIH